MTDKRMIDADELIANLGFGKDCNSKCPRFYTCNSDYEELNSCDICSIVGTAIDETLKGNAPNPNNNTVTLTEEEATDVVCFIKRHEREEIPDAVWDVCMKIMETLNIC